MDDMVLIHYGVKGQKWGVRNYQNPDGSYKPGAEGRYDDGEVSSKSAKKEAMSKSYRASNGMTVGAPRTGYQKAMRKLATSKFATAAAENSTRKTIFDSKSTRDKKDQRKEQIRNEQNAIKEFNARNKDIKRGTGTKYLDKAVRNTKIDDAKTSIKKNSSTFSKMLYNDATFTKAGKNVVDKHMDEKTALKSAKTSAWINTGIYTAASLGLSALTTYAAYKAIGG